MQTHIFYDEPLDGDVARGKCNQVGLVNMNWLQSATPWSEAEFYICGPKPFMQNVHNYLHELKVDETRIHVEFFGPSQSLVPATT